MYINFWYVACQSADITFGAQKPLKITMLGHQFALWRDTDGQVKCVSNTCTHRSGALADGRIRGDCIECPYHGWTFNGDGTCVRLPSLGADAKIPERTRVDAYPVEEKYGLVHVFLGDLPEAERLAVELLRTDTATFQALIEARRHRAETWFIDPADHIGICNVPLPVRSLN